MMLDTPLTRKQIATRLHVTPDTVHYHTERVYRLLGVTTRIDAITAWQELGR